MKILIDLQGTQNNSRTRGIGRFTRTYAKALVENNRDHDIYILLNGLLRDSVEDIIQLFDGLLDREKFVVFEGVGPAAEVDGIVWPSNIWRMWTSELLMERFLADLHVDAVIICSLFEGAQDDTVNCLTHFDRDYIAAIILHDLIPLLDVDKFLTDPASRRWYFRKLESFKAADLLLAVSESARQEAIEYAHIPSDKVVVSSSAADPDFSPVPDARDQQILGRHKIRKRFLLHVSAFEPRKNFEGLIRAFALLPAAVRNDHQLVLVCKLSDNQRQKIDELAAEAGLNPGDVVATGFISDADLPAFYRRAHLFVFPALHEGFGLPPLEAMACGTPAIGANNSSIPEVIGWNEALFDSHDDQDMANLIEKALTDDAFYQALQQNAARQAKHFQWKRVADRTFDALEERHRLKGQAGPHPRPRAISVDAVIREMLKFQAPALPSSDDLLATANALAANEARARTFRAHARATDKLLWRIEGPFDSSYSLALVNREIARALADYGVKVVLHSTEGPGDIPVDPDFLIANPDLAEMHARCAQYGEADGDVTTRNLYPPRVADMQAPQRGMHMYGWEESGFPHKWVDRFNDHLTFMTVISRHVQKIMIDNGVRVPMLNSGNGVDHWDRIVPSAPPSLDAKHFRFLHVSSCFPRKGVDVMLEAFGKAFTSEHDVTLVIKTFPNPHNDVEDQLAALRAKNPQFPDVLLIQDDLSDEALKALYLACDVMVGPSRAEGYCLPFAEAMLSGIPVITTNWGGQLEFCNPSNAWLVDYSFEQADTHFGIFSSAWVRPDVDDLARAMVAAAGTSANDRAAMAKAGQTLLLQDHSWSAVAARLLDAQDRLTGSETPSPRIGWISTWGTRCGIATYSEHLVGHMPGEVTVFAPDAAAADIVHPDGLNVYRSWTVGKDRNDFERVEATILSLELDTIVIQFNYAFYNHDELSRLIHWLKDQGIAVILMVHSTKDPVVEIPGAELFRFADALRRCDRILVHAIADLNNLKRIDLVDNVALFPHGALNRPEPAPRATPRRRPLVATYGFCLPHKGLGEVLEAAALLKASGDGIALRMVNAELPAPVSTNLVATLKERAVELGLDSDDVSFHSDFLPDEESFALLSDADLVLFAYQQTGESASGAVRYGLAARRPVAVTPLPIFDDIKGAAFRLDGFEAPSIAQSLRTILASLETDDEQAQTVAAGASRWIEQHDYAVVGNRLHNICVALANNAAYG